MTSTIEKQWNGREVKIAGRRIVNKSAFEIGLIVEAQAKALTPVAMGYLRASITTQSNTRGTEPERPQPSFEAMKNFTGGVYSGPMKIAAPLDDTEVLVGTAVEYAPYVEFGTVRSDAQPFLRPALDLARGRALTIIKDEGRFGFKEYLQ